jgi:transposase InsO family protein
VLTHLTARRLSVAHPRSKLTPFGRLFLVRRVQDEGLAPAEAARTLGVSRATVYKWLRRYREEGVEGLQDRPSRAHGCRHALRPEQVQLVLLARRHYRYGPHRLGAALGMARSTIYGVLRRHGESRLVDFDRLTSVPIRYVRERPGELVHLDIKKLGRIPPEGGHHFAGRGGIRQSNRRRQGFDYLHVAVDDATRWAFVEVLPDERGETTAAFLRSAATHFASLGVVIERVLTDQGKAYTTSRSFATALEQLDIRHKLTRPYRPQTNGKAERLIRTLLAEWAYARPYPSNEERLAQLPGWVDFYNRRRSHTALGGRTPAQALVNNGDGNYN